MKNVLEPSAKSVLIPLRSTAATSATDAAIHEKMFESGTATLIILNEEINDIMRIVASLEESGLLIVSEVLELAKQLKMKQKNERKNSQYVIRYIRC